MSTKIYNGFRIRTLNGLEFNGFILDLRGRLKEVLIEKYYRTFIDLSMNTISRLIILDNEYASTKNPEKINSYLTHLYRISNISIPRYIKKMDEIYCEDEMAITDIIKNLNYSYVGSISNIMRKQIETECEKINITKIRNNEFDFISELCVLPIDTQYTLLLAYGDDFENMLYTICKSRKKVNKDFCANYGLEYYGYWDNTDKPKSVSMKLWTKRQEDWDMVLPGCSIPSMRGIGIDILSYSAFFDELTLNLFHQKINKKYFPSMNEFSYKVAKNEHFISFCDKYIENHKDDNESTWSLYCDANKLYQKKWKESDKELLENFEIYQKQISELFSGIDKNSIYKTAIYFLKNYMNDNPIN